MWGSRVSLQATLVRIPGEVEPGGSQLRLKCAEGCWSSAFGKVGHEVVQGGFFGRRDAVFE